MLKRVNQNRLMLVSLAMAMATGLLTWGAIVTESPVLIYALLTLCGMEGGIVLTMCVIHRWMKRNGYIVGKPIPVMVAHADADDDD